jgi:hypothetical protein
LILEGFGIRGNLTVSHWRLANCAKSIVTREGVAKAEKGYVVPEVGLLWPEWIKA